jgi:SAM-dependent methyltransferase
MLQTTRLDHSNELLSDLKQQVKSYWEAEPCETDRALSQIHTREYFEEIERARYTSQPFIHSFAQFTRWRGKRVLEIGCGAGTDTLQFARAGAVVTAVDLTVAAVALTCECLSFNGLSAEVLQGDAEGLPFVDNQFDLVYSWGVLHHSPDTQRTFDEILRVLKPGGSIVVMLYNRRSLVAWRMWQKFALRAARPLRSISSILARHMESPGTKAYTRAELRHMFSRFSEVAIEPVLTPYDLYRLPGWMRTWLPAAWGWNLVVTGRKPSE